MTSDLKRETGTTYHATRTLNTSYQAYRARVAAKAIQTDINLKKVIPMLENRIAIELAGIFQPKSTLSLKQEYSYFNEK